MFEWWSNTVHYRHPRARNYSARSLYRGDLDIRAILLVGGIETLLGGY